MPSFCGKIHKLRLVKRLNARPSRSMRRVQQIRIIIIDRPLIHPLFLPCRGKTGRHKADRFSRLIHLVEVNKHCVPYLFSAQLMRGTLCPLSHARPPLSSSSSSSFQPYVPFSPSLLLPHLPANLFHLLPPAPLVLSLTRYYLCR